MTLKKAINIGIRTARMYENAIGVDTTALLSRARAAQYLGLRPQTLASWACSKKYDLPYVKIGSRVFYRWPDLEAFVTARTIGGGRSSTGGPTG